MGVFAADLTDAQYEDLNVSRVLAVLLPFAGALSEYNNAVVNGDEPSSCFLYRSRFKVMVCHQILADFLNRLLRLNTEWESLRKDVEDADVFFPGLREWIDEIESDFEFGDVEQEVAEALGYDVAPLSELMLTHDGRIQFIAMDEKDSPDDEDGVCLEVIAVPTSPNVIIPMFRSVGGFTEIDDTVLLNAIQKAVSRLLELRSGQGTKPAASENRGYIKLSDAEAKIVGVVKSAKHRLTTVEIHSALEKLYGATSLGMTKQNLAHLVRIGELDNKQDSQPPGYGLSQWS